MIIDLNITWKDPPDKVSGGALAWGAAQLNVNGTPVWFGGKSEVAPEPLEWSWIELLEFLAAKWSYLRTEQAYPFNLTPDEPRTLRKTLRKLLDEEWDDHKKDLYDEEVFRFEDRHDLARALRGLHVPSVFVVREGNNAWIATEDAAGLFPLAQVVSDLSAIGTKIAERISSSCTTSARAKSALESWANREVIKPGLVISLATGLSKDEFSAKLPKDSLEFWELEQVSGADSEIACAARMVKGGYTSEDDRFAIAHEVRKLVHKNTSKSEPLVLKLKDKLERLLAKDPYEQGYTLASDVRYELQLGDGLVHPDQVLITFSVVIIDVILSEAIDAVGCWGPRHGPAVLINQRGKHAATAWGRRATLAHELCHFLIDRSLSLPLAEVLGGRSPYRLERRANAFAAELLLPRAAAREEYAKHRSAQPTLDSLCSRFGVGVTVAANQLKNADPRGITASERAHLEKLVKGDDLNSN